MTDWGADAAHDTRQHLTHVARGGAIGLVGAACSAIAGFALVLVVTNRFPAHTAGLFFAATSLFLLLSAVATLGSETGLARFMLRYEAQGRSGDIPPTLRAAVRPAVVSSLGLAVLLVVLAGPVSRLVGLGQGGQDSVRVLGVLLPFATWSTLTLAGTRAFGNIRTTVLVDQIARPVAQPVLALVVSLAGAGLLALTVAWAIPYAMAAVASAVLSRRFMRRRRAVASGSPTDTYRSLRRDFWSFTWPRAITRMAQMAIQRLDIVLVAALRSPAEAAVYTAATRFVALGQFGTQAIQQVLQPKFTALLANEEHGSLQEVYKVATAWSMCIAWPMYLTVGCAPLAYLGVFGKGYSASATATVVLMSLTMLFAVASGAADTLLLMSGRSGFSLANNLVAVALDIGLCLWLIPHMGITGAAVAWAIASSTRSLCAVLQCRLTLNVASFGRPALTAAAANVLCIAVPLLALSLVMEVHLMTLLVVLVLAAPAYLGVLWLGRRPLMLGVLRDLVRRRSGRDAQSPQEAA